MYTINADVSYNADELKNLFSSVGWAMHLSKEQLYEAINNSTHYVIARSNGILVGFARSMDDDIWSANIDCVVVHKDFQKQGIGKALLLELIKIISHIQYISVVPNSPENIPLYLKCGFSLIEEGRLLQLTNIKEE